MTLLRFVVATLCLYGCDMAVFVPLDAGPRLVGIQPSERTSELDGPDADPRVLVLRDVSFSSEGTRGWDLDTRCTLAVEEGQAPDFECSATNDLGSHVLDYPGCRDDAYGSQVAGAFQPLGSELETALNEATVRGVSGFLLRLSEWSGQPDDPHFVVELAPIAFGVPSGGLRGDPLDWNGLDTFSTFVDAVEPDGRAAIRSDDAYVTGGHFVARFANAPVFVLRGADSSVSLRLTDAILTGEIEGGRAADLVLSGRWAVDDLIGQLDAVGVCEGDALRVAAEIRIRDSPDVRAQPRGGTGTSSPCEALSVSIGFVGYAGIWGDALEPDTPPAVSCPDS